MTSRPEDYAGLDKFNFEYKPVAVQFAIARPEGIKRIEKELNMCEMLKEAQDNDAFYVTPEDWVCVGVEQVIIGLQDLEPVLVSGIFGGEEGLFKTNSACRAMYDYIPTLAKGSVQYVVFSPLDQLSFEPDVVVITATASQAQTLLRSINYSTGKPIVSKYTPVIACSWIYIYPVVSGELNYFITGMGMGIQAMNIFPPGLFIISVPFQLIPIMLENIKEMGYSPELAPGPGGPAHRKRVNQVKKDMIKKIEQ
jgi:uncharacterized protein (DUF169 family)